MNERKCRKFWESGKVDEGGGGIRSRIDAWMHEGDAGPRCYKRVANPRKMLPKTAATLRPSPGTNEAGAAPPGVLLAVAPPNPVTGMSFVAEAVGATVEDMVEGMEVLPR